jgi:hypothetical protein
VPTWWCEAFLRIFFILKRFKQVRIYNIAPYE